MLHGDHETEHDAADRKDDQPPTETAAAAEQAAVAAAADNQPPELDDDGEPLVAEALMKRHHAVAAFTAAATSAVDVDARIGAGMDIAIHGENGEYLSISLITSSFITPTSCRNFDL